MIAYSPFMGRPPARLGQSGVTGAVAKAIVAEAEPATRRLIRDERTRLAEALIGGIPFAALSAVSFAATSYLVPEKKRGAKFIGYAASAGLLGGGAWWTFSRLSEEAVPAAQPGKPGPFAGTAEDAARAIVQEAEPRIKEIVDEERSRIAEALITAVPFWAAATLAAVATMFLVPDGAGMMKTVGYGGAALIYAMGAWAGLEKEKG